jgi:hypothetical protein
MQLHIYTMLTEGFCCTELTVAGLLHGKCSRLRNWGQLVVQGTSDAILQAAIGYPFIKGPTVYVVSVFDSYLEFQTIPELQRF